MQLKTVLKLILVSIILVKLSVGFALRSKRSLIHVSRPLNKNPTLGNSNEEQDERSSTKPTHTCKTETIKMPPPKRKRAADEEGSEEAEGQGRPGQDFKGMEKMPVGVPLTEPENYEEEMQQLKTEGRSAGAVHNFSETIDSSWWDREIKSQGKGAVNDWQRRWWTYKMPIQIDKSFGKIANKAIQNALWTLYLAMDKCFKITIVDPDCIVPDAAIKNFVYIKQAKADLGYCYSALGMTGGKQEIVMPWACSTFMIVHEVMHALGFYHEMNRPDRDKYLKVDFDKMTKDKYEYKDQYYIAGNQKLYVPEYDFDSIMHYELNKYVTAKVKIPKGVHVGQQNHLSKLDFERLKAMYSCDNVFGR